MLNFLKDLVSNNVPAWAKFNDREAAEGVVAIMIGTSNADGEFEPAERAKFAKALQVNPILQQFDSSVLVAKAKQLQDQFDFDVEVGIGACLKELAEAAKGAPEEKRIGIGRMGVAAAKADGELEEAEVVFLRRACDALAISPSQIGL